MDNSDDYLMIDIQGTMNSQINCYKNVNNLTNKIQSTLNFWMSILTLRPSLALVMTLCLNISLKMAAQEQS